MSANNIAVQGRIREVLSFTSAFHNSKSLQNHFWFNREEIGSTVFLALLKLNSSQCFVCSLSKKN